MTGRKFLSFIGVILLITAVVYYFTTPSGKYIPLTGVIDGNEVVVSPQITGRIVNLTVDEGSVVKKGDSDCGARLEGAGSNSFRSEG
jgi:multidrug resistance efflux pump